MSSFAQLTWKKRCSLSGIVLFVLAGLSLSMAFPVRLSWQDAALQGGGLAVGQNGLWGNPAAKDLVQRQFYEGGIQVRSDSLLPWGVFTIPIGKESALSMGGFWGPQGQVRAASRLLSGTWVGVVAEWNGEVSGSVDAGFGVKHQLSDAIHVGWVGRNLATDSLRELGLGAAWYFDPEFRHALFVDVFQPGLIFSEMEKMDLNAGLRTQFGPNRNLQAATSVRIQDVGGDLLPSLGFGVAFQQYFFSTLVSLRYAITDFQLTGDGSMAHQVSLGVVWDAFVDREAPQPLVRINKNILSISDTLLPNELDFLMRIDDPSGQLSSWSLVIYSAKSDLAPGRLVRRFTAQGQVPQSIHWRMDDMGGYPCPPGLYAFRLIATDAAGNQGWTEWQHFEIR